MIQDYKHIFQFLSLSFLQFMDRQNKFINNYV
nr:MAG TPA: hypothetical protein [Caudoviricetes sp.]DAU59398.1 MAG TPA: hypothetical protein [Crassvirales sp.]